MPDYDFLNLSAIDFEELVRDLLQKHFDLYLESFAQGPDGGVDLRFSIGKSKAFIVQCKRVKNISSLMKILKGELEKVKKLKPSRYIVATSAALTPAGKQKIVKLFKSYIKSTDDIFGRQDLNNLLGIHSDIETRHFKLWISSTAIIKKLQHLDIVNRSEFEYEQIKRSIKVYVQNESYPEAVNLLKQYNYVVISGIPGIGKTTLARMLAYQYVAKGYELVAVSGDISEAEKVQQKGKKIVFYYDDFLGTNFLSAPLNKNEDKRLIQFIEKIMRSKTNKLIMTTREYILQQARIKHEILDKGKIDISKCILNLSKYNNIIKAKILYNHLYFSKLDYAYIESLLCKNRYLHVIKHPNYSPRIIEFMSDARKIEEVDPDDYYDYFMSNLNNPVEIWRHAFDNQIEDMAKYVLFALMVSGGSTRIDILERTFKAIVKKECEKYPLDVNRATFRRSLKELEDTFISITRDEEKCFVSFQNPSIQDFLVYFLKDELEIIEVLINSVPYFNQLTSIYKMQPTGEEENKLVLTKELTEIFCEKIIGAFSSESFVMEHYITKGDTTYFYSEYQMSDMDKLYEIAQFIEIDESDKLSKFVNTKFHEAISRKTIGNDVSLLLKLLVELRNEENMLINEGILLYLRSMDGIESVESLKEFEEYWPGELSQILEEMGSELATIIERAVTDEVSSIVEIDSGELLSKRMKIEEIESLYSVDLSCLIDEMEEKAVKEEEEELDDELSDYKEDIADTDNEDLYIEEMFKSMEREGFEGRA